MDTLMHIEHLSVGYRAHPKPLVSGFDADLPGGKCVMLVGRNGTGKSTMLRTIAGIHEPLGGTVNLDGSPMASLSANSRARRVSMVFSPRNVTRNLTVLELVELGRIPYTGRLGKMSGSDRAIVQEAIDSCGLVDLQHKKLNSVSDGEMQKAMIARALAQDTQLMLLDEPTAYLDLGNKIAITELLARLCEEKEKTVIFSSHDLPVSLRVAHEVWFLDGNGGVWRGSPSQLAEEGLASLLAPGFELTLSSDNYEIKWKRKTQ